MSFVLSVTFTRPSVFLEVFKWFNDENAIFGAIHWVNYSLVFIMIGRIKSLGNCQKARFYSFVCETLRRTAPTNNSLVIFFWNNLRYNLIIDSSERLSFTFMSNVKSEFAARGQVSPLLFVYFSLFVHINYSSVTQCFIRKNFFALFLSAHFLFWEILNLNLTSAVCRIREALPSTRNEMRLSLCIIIWWWWWYRWWSL